MSDSKGNQADPKKTRQLHLTHRPKSGNERQKGVARSWKVIYKDVKQTSKPIRQL